MHESTLTVHLRAVLQLTQTQIQILAARRERTADPVRLREIADDLEHALGYRDALEQALQDGGAPAERPSARAARLSRCVEQIATSGDGRRVAVLERVLREQLVDRTRALARLTAAGDHRPVHYWARRYLAHCRSLGEPQPAGGDEQWSVRSR
ncbi:hypothetical protein [Rhodococcus aetherivorans]|uniref:hypothetical protein n=1 Tax=Rhodococcus aetherivorans TaxID=191292 RepID=UPI001E5CC1A6|nr:hypothetical protein [Rhodococcus aetherivorans]UGQ43976.1 hypothetical protein LRQ66_12250 [Rhodococcus aetherivorans]